MLLVVREEQKEGNDNKKKKQQTENKKKLRVDPVPFSMIVGAFVCAGDARKKEEKDGNVRRGGVWEGNEDEEEATRKCVVLRVQRVVQQWWVRAKDTEDEENKSASRCFDRCALFSWQAKRAGQVKWNRFEAQTVIGRGISSK